jgi:hypothetical protein
MNTTPNKKKLNVQWFPTLCNHNVLELLDKLYSEEIKQVKREDIDLYRIYWKDSTINSSCVFSSEGLDYYIDDSGDVVYTKVKEEKEEKVDKRNHKDVQKIKTDISRNQHLSFDHFISTVDTLLYFENMVENDRYSLQDITSWDYKSSLDVTISRTIERQSFLEATYKMIGIEKTPEEIENIMEKYSTWFYVSLKRIYKKYIDEDYEIEEEERDGEGESNNHIFI